MSFGDVDGFDDDVLGGLVAHVGGHFGDLVDDGLRRLVDHLAENRVLAVKPGRRGHGDEELRSVGPRPGVRHGEHIRVVEVQLGVDLVLELVAGASGSATQRVASLDHEAVDHAVEDRAVIERLSGLLSRSGVGPLALARRQLDEVRDCFGCVVGIQLHDDVAVIGVKCCFHVYIFPQCRGGMGGRSIHSKLMRCGRKRVGRHRAQSAFGLTFRGKPGKMGEYSHFRSTPDNRRRFAVFCCRSKKKKAKKKAAQAQDLMAQAGAVASQAAEKIRPVAAHLATQAQELAHQGKEWVAPKAAQAAQLAAEAKDKAVTDYIPKAKRVARAAVDAARTTEGDLKTKAQAVQASATAALADPKPKKKRRFLKLTGTLAILGGAAGAAVLLWKRSQPVEDPWAESYWEDVEVPTEDSDEAESGKHKA